MATTLTSDAVAVAVQSLLAKTMAQGVRCVPLNETSSLIVNRRVDKSCPPAIHNGERSVTLPLEPLRTIPVTTLSAVLKHSLVFEHAANLSTYRR
jgi:hypothetical protein